LAELCGEGEWYVGTRGGAGDHAAMLFCKRESICHLRFFPFEVDRYLRIPEGYAILIANSLKSAHKAGAVLDAYNQTIAAYNMVLMLIKEAMDERGLPNVIILADSNDIEEWRWSDRIDFALLDGNHNRRTISHEMNILYPIICPGGIVCVHDVWSQAAEGWADIREEYGMADDLMLLYNNGLGILRKPYIEEFEKHQAYVVRVFSAIWLVFYLSAAMLLRARVQADLEQKREQEAERS